VVKAHCYRIKLAERDRIVNVIEEETSLLGNAIERKSFDLQTGFFWCAVTGFFRAAQLVVTPEKSI
jgi:hypothetical protein